MAFLCDLPFGVLVPAWQSKEGRYPAATFEVTERKATTGVGESESKRGFLASFTPKDRVGVSSHLTPLSCKPFDRCMGNGLA